MKSYDYDEHENTWSRTYRRTLKEFLIAASPEFTEEFRRVFERRITDMQPSWSESSKVANKAEERSAERKNMQERCDSEAGINNLLLGDSEFERARERQERFDTRISEEKHGKQLQNNYGSTFSDFSTMERRMRRRSYFEIRSSSPILDVRNRSLVEKSCGTYDRWSGANEEYFKDNAFHEDTNEELNDHKQNSEMCQGHIGRCFRKSTVRPTYSGRPARCNNLSGQERHPKIIIPVDSSHHSWEVSTNRMKAYRIPVKHGTSYPSDDDRIRYSERDYVVPNIQDIIGDERISDREQSKTIKRESPLEEIHDSRQKDSDNRKNDSGWWIQGISQAETCGETEVRRQEAYSRMEQTSSQFNEHEESKWTTRERGSPSSLSNDLNFTESQEAELSKVRAASPSSTQIPKKVSIPRYTYKKTETRNGDLYKYDEERYFENEHHEESQPEPEYGYHDGPEIAEIYSDKMSSTDCSPTTKTIIDDDDERINVEIRHRVNVKLNRRSDKTNRPAYVPSTVVDSDAYSEPCRRCGGKGAEQLLRQNQQEIDRNPRIRFDADWKIPESSQLAKDEFFHVHEKIRQRQPLG
ncbi:hypothetical protein AB6A40_003550 [Gnathostoma spinigerum]|uniref:Uncharacterized protein n=1 Tax=Gnathostoma spinigerum TaxID=75299 RepID=A0ABD6EHH8_9BILA